MCYFGGEFGWACFWPIHVIFVVGEPLCGVGTPGHFVWACFWPIKVIFVVGEPLCGKGTPS